MKISYKVVGSEKRFGDIWREFTDAETALKAAEEMHRDGIKHIEVTEVTQYPTYQTGHSIKCYW